MTLPHPENPEARLVLLAPAIVFYQVPLYRRLARAPGISFRAVFASRDGVDPHDAGFGQTQQVDWGIDVLEGYESSFLPGAQVSHVSDGFLGLKLKGLLQLMLEVRRERAALWLHGYSYALMLCALILAKVLRIPVLVREEQTVLDVRRGLKQRIRPLVLRQILRNCFGLYISSSNRQFFLDHGIAPDKLFFVPYCSSIAEFDVPATPSRAALRQAWGVSDATVVFLFVGKLEEKKCPELLAQAFKAVPGDVALVLAGDGPLKEAVSARLKGTRHIMLGFVDRREIGGVFRASDVLVLPSLERETWGVVVSEAMNFGLPVIVSDRVGSAVDLATPEQVFPAGSERALATRLRLVASDPTIRVRLGSANRARVENWNYDVASQGILHAVAEVVRLRGGNDD